MRARNIFLFHVSIARANQQSNLIDDSLWDLVEICREGADSLGVRVVAVMKTIPKSRIPRVGADSRVFAVAICRYSDELYARLFWTPRDCRWAISFGSRIKLWAAQLKTNSQSTFSRPRYFTRLTVQVCLSHPKHFSTSHLRLRLMT